MHNESHIDQIRSAGAKSKALGVISKVSLARSLYVSCVRSMQVALLRKQSCLEYKSAANEEVRRI